MEVNRYKHQADKTDDGMASIMPLHIYRVTWKDLSDTCFEFWTESYQTAWDKKYAIDHDKNLSYLNFESWFAYRSDFYHDKVENKIK
jgi:hypothetical protein